MSLIHAGLAAGAALAALPVILHLFMRQTPKHVIFPALRLIRERQQQSKKRLRIKNWLLLLARMAILALMALALARPRLYSQVPLGDESVPTALGLVFDTSLSMEYKDKDKTRLDEAKERAKEIVAKLPDSSLVFVVDSAEPGVPIGLPPSAALKRIEGLTIRAVNRPLNAAMGQVYAAVAECDRPVHVVYVLTDLARSAWDPIGRPKGSTRLPSSKRARGSKIATFVLRLAPQEIQNVAVDSAEPSSSVATQGEPVEIRSSDPIAGHRPRRRGWSSSSSTASRRARNRSRFPPTARQEVSFITPPRLRGRRGARGKVKLSGTPDPFESDDERYFTFKVRPPLKVLVDLRPDLRRRVCRAPRSIPTRPRPPPGRIWSREIHAADFGRTLQERSRKPTPASSCSTSEQLDEPDWGALNRYVHEGGGLVVAPGHRSLPESYNNRSPASSCRRSSTSGPRSPRREPPSARSPTSPIRLFQRYGKELDSHARAGAGLPLLADQATRRRGRARS